MGLPRPKLYTAESLAKDWGVDVSRIHSYNQSGQLIAKLLIKRVNGNGELFYPEDYEVNEIMLSLDGLKYVGKVYKLEEVKRFEKEQGINTTPAQEDYPSLLPVENNEERIYTLKDIASEVGLTPDYMKHNWKKINCPINKSGQKTYVYPSQLKAWQATRNKK